MRYLLALACLLALSQQVPAAPADLTAESTPVGQQEKIKPLPPGRVEVRLKDLHCMGCAKKVARKLYALRGVSKVESSLEKDLVVIQVPKDRPVAAAALWRAVVDGGVEPTEIRYAEERLDQKAMKEVLRQASRESSAK